MRDQVTVTARWLFPGVGPPLERGVLTAAGGRVAAVTPRGDRTPDQDLGNVALLPGFVNAHTHLDLTGLRGAAPYDGDFPAWLRTVIGHRMRRTPEQVRQDVQDGIAECRRHDTVLVGDVSGGGLSWDALAAGPLRAVVFHELLGLTEARAAEAWAAAAAFLRDRPPTPFARPGLSPHAPYSVRAGLFRAAARLARRWGCPVSTHLAETADEARLLAARDGPFVAFLQDLGVWDPSGLVGGWGDIVAANRGVPAVYAHGNHLDPRAPLPADASVVYCPRTHAFFGHPPHPFRELLARGVNVALGTDSLASNPDLSVLAEARFLHRRYPDVPGATLLHLATLAGARALGWQDDLGSLEPGKLAAYAAVPLPDADAADPHRLWLAP